MKKIKLLSALTALTLMTVPCASLTANARALTEYGGTYGTAEDFVKNTFGEDAVFEYSPSNYFYIVITPDDIGDFCMGEPYLIVKVKENSDVDLVRTVKKDCSLYMTGEKVDDTTYKLYGNDLWNHSGERLEEVYSAVVSFLSERDDVVSINRCYDFMYESYNNTSCRIMGFSIGVSGDVDFDYEKYSDYVVEPYVYENLNYLSINYDAEKYHFRHGYDADYFKHMYDAYVNLAADYGDENVDMGVCIQESAGGGEMQTAGENLYTAAIKGDVNSDGVVDISDVVAVSAYVGDSENNSIKGQSMINGDVHNNGDGLTANDVLKIQQYLAGNIEEL